MKLQEGFRSKVAELVPASCKTKAMHWQKLAFFYQNGKNNICLGRVPRLMLVWTSPTDQLQSLKSKFLDAEWNCSDETSIYSDWLLFLAGVKPNHHVNYFNYKTKEVNVVQSLG